MLLRRLIPSITTKRLTINTLPLPPSITATRNRFPSPNQWPTITQSNSNLPSRKKSIKIKFTLINITNRNTRLRNPNPRNLRKSRMKLPIKKMFIINPLITKSNRILTKRHHHRRLPNTRIIIRNNFRILRISPSRDYQNPNRMNRVKMTLTHRNPKAAPPNPNPRSTSIRIFTQTNTTSIIIKAKRRSIIKNFPAVLFLHLNKKQKVKCKFFLCCCNRINLYAK